MMFAINIKCIPICRFLNCLQPTSQLSPISLLDHPSSYIATNLPTQPTVFFLCHSPPFLVNCLLSQLPIFVLCQLSPFHCHSSPFLSSVSFLFHPVLRIRIRDPGLGTFLTPGSGIRDGRKSASGSGIRDEQPGSLFLELKKHFFVFLGVKILKFFEDRGSGIRDGDSSDPGSGMEKSRIRDPG